MARTKADAIKTVVECAERFEAELNKRKLLLICTDKHRRVSSIELTFHSWNRMTTAKAKGGVESLALERVNFNEILPGDERLIRIEAVANSYSLPPEQTYIVKQRFSMEDTHSTT